MKRQKGHLAYFWSDCHLEAIETPGENPSRVSLPFWIDSTYLGSDSYYGVPFTRNPKYYTRVYFYERSRQYKDRLLFSSLSLSLALVHRRGCDGLRG